MLVLRSTVPNPISQKKNDTMLMVVAVAAVVPLFYFVRSRFESSTPRRLHRHEDQGNGKESRHGSRSAPGQRLWLRTECAAIGWPLGGAVFQKVLAVGPPGSVRAHAVDGILELDGLGTVLAGGGVVGVLGGKSEPFGGDGALFGPQVVQVHEIPTSIDGGDDGLELGALDAHHRRSVGRGAEEALVVVLDGLALDTVDAAQRVAILPFVHGKEEAVEVVVCAGAELDVAAVSGHLVPDAGIPGGLRAAIPRDDHGKGGVDVRLLHHEAVPRHGTERADAVVVRGRHHLADAEGYLPRLVRGILLDEQVVLQTCDCGKVHLGGGGIPLPVGGRLAAQRGHGTLEVRFR